MGFPPSALACDRSRGTPAPRLLLYDGGDTPNRGIGPEGGEPLPMLPPMALVRCTCVVQLTAHGRAEVSLLDPACDYVVHRLGAELSGTATPEPPQ